MLHQIERRDTKEAAEVALERSRPVLDELGLSWPTREAGRDVCILDRLTRLRAGVSVDARVTRWLLAYFLDEHEGHPRSQWFA
jgi:hypothetical protein